MPLLTLLSNVPASAWLSFGDAVLKATILLATSALLSRALRHASAAARHAVWTLALVGALILPALSIALPRWQLPIFTVTASASAAPLPAEDRDVAIAPPLAEPGGASRRALAPAPAAPVVTTTAFEMPQIPLGAALLLIWAFGAGIILCRLAAGLAVVGWLSRRTEQAIDAPWLPLARSLAQDLGVSPRIAFMRSGRAVMPMAWGAFRPAVIMPTDADTWPAERLRIVLLHELAHVKRRDCLTHLVAQIACALYWFNPLAWMAARQVRAERERACDDLVLAAGTRSADYADHLLEIARVMRSGRFPSVLAGASLAMAHRSQLEGRLMAILDPSVPRSGMSKLRTAGATAAFACALMPLASMQPWRYATEQVPKPAPADVRLESRQPAPDVRVKTEVRVKPDTRSKADIAVETDIADAVQGAVALTLDGIVQPTVSAVLESLGSADQVKEPAAKNKAADPRTIAALSAALKDTDKEVRESALHALVQLRDPNAFEPLVQALRDAAADVREQAAFGLGQMRDRRAIDPLIAALKDENGDVREQVVFALGQLRDRAAVVPLSALIKDVDDDVREQVVFALGQLRDASTVEALATALRDAKEDVREQAAFALGQIRDSKAVPALITALKDADPDVREQAAFALGQVRDRSAVDPLIVALKDANAQVREQAAFALGQIGDERAVDALTDALKDASAQVRQQAAFALGQIAR